MRTLTESRRRQSGSSGCKKDSESDDDENTICSRAAIKRSVVYYLKNSTLHGLKYIAEESISIPERYVSKVAESISLSQRSRTLEEALLYI